MCGVVYLEDCEVVFVAWISLDWAWAEPSTRTSRRGIGLSSANSSRQERSWNSQEQSEWRSCSAAAIKTVKCMETWMCKR